jgi:esterase/lipase superfamily enzyme
MQGGTTTIALSILTLVFVSLGVHHVISPIEPNRCKMTYSRPMYSIFDVVSEYDYETFRYRNSRASSSNKKSVPVIFVPGHKGEFTQVRSLGSVADKLQTDKIQLEYYTIDFKDSLSGIVGFQTIDQAKYLNDVLRAVSSRYKSNTPILIVAHSMGGFVARAAYTMSNFNVTNVATIVTLSTPQIQPPVGVDRVLNRLYGRVNTIWTKVVNANNTAHQSAKLKAMRKVSIVSIAGGSRDPLVRKFSSSAVLFESLT